MRNGIIDRWDSRQPGGKTDLIANLTDAGQGHNRGAASIDYLRILHEHELLVRTMRGDVRLWPILTVNPLQLLRPFAARDPRSAVLA